jgi:hypothetical protein
MRNYTISKHAAQQAEQKGWTLAEIYAAANSPVITYQNGRYPNQMRHIRGDVVAIVDPKAQRIITVYKNVVETPLRPDQR